MAFVPVFTLRSANNATTVYTFPVVQSTNLPQSTANAVTKTSFRSKGAVVIEGGSKEFNAIIDFILYDNSGEYEAIASLIENLETTIPQNTPFILRMPRSATANTDYRVKRIEPFEYQDVETDQRIFKQKVRVIFLAHAW